jgi:catechol 2,3-dioxygenase-like lactoylglutathione lyase family enzyme
MTLKALRTAFTVSNMDRSLAFYTKVLGFELLYDKMRDGTSFETMLGIPNVKLRVVALKASAGSDHLLELVEYMNPRPQSNTSRFTQVGSANVCYVVDDIESVFQKLKSSGAQFVNPPCDYVREGKLMGQIMFALDPDGIAVGLFEPLKP